MLVYISHDKHVKKESVTKNSDKVSGIKTARRRKMLPKVKKQMKNKTISLLETGFVKRQTLRNIYIIY